MILLAVAARTFARGLAFHPGALLDLLAVRRAAQQAASSGPESGGESAIEAAVSAALLWPGPGQT